MSTGIPIEKLKAGDLLYDCHAEKAGNTSASRDGVWEESGEAMTWKEWRVAVLAEAADIEAAAKLLERLELSVSPVAYAGLGIHGRAALDEGESLIRDARAHAVFAIRATAVPLREMVTIAKWLAEPGRDLVLEAVSQSGSAEQREAANRLRLTRTAVETITHRKLWRPSNPQYTGFERDNARIDRTVAGARLYAATKGS